jgi:hypothetical protein
MAIYRSTIAFFKTSKSGINGVSRLREWIWIILPTIRGIIENVERTKAGTLSLDTPYAMEPLKT